MARSTDDENPSRVQRVRDRREDARDRVQAARNQVNHELANYGHVSEQSKRELAVAAVQYRDVLLEYREDREDEWEESGVDQIEALIGQTVSVPVSTPGDTNASVAEERPAITQADPRDLIEVTHRLDKIVNSLGFSEKPSEPTPHDDLGMDTLRHLLKARGQDRALEGLPDPKGDEEEVSAD